MARTEPFLILELEKAPPEDYSLVPLDTAPAEDFGGVNGVLCDGSVRLIDTSAALVASDFFFV
jgi:hypothetical protein